MNNGKVLCSSADKCCFRAQGHEGPFSAYRHQHLKYGPALYVRVTGSEDNKNLPEDPAVVCSFCMRQIVDRDRTATFISLSEYDRRRLSAKFANLREEKRQLEEKLSVLESAATTDETPGTASRARRPRRTKSEAAPQAATEAVTA